MFSLVQKTFQGKARRLLINMLKQRGFSDIVILANTLTTGDEIIICGDSERHAFLNFFIDKIKVYLYYFPVQL